MACPHCFRTGFVHVEYLIRGDSTVQTFRCTACGYEWEQERGSDDPPSSDKRRSSLTLRVVRLVSRAFRHNLTIPIAGYFLEHRSRRLRGVPYHAR